MALGNNSGSWIVIFLASTSARTTSRSMRKRTKAFTKPKCDFTDAAFKPRSCSCSSKASRSYLVISASFLFLPEETGR